MSVRMRRKVAALLIGLIGTTLLVPTATANALPVAPVLVSPAPSSDAAGNPVLDWQAVPGATSYRVQLSTSPTFSPLLPDSTITRATSYAPPSDLPTANIYWEVQAIDGSGNGVWAVSQFNRVALPGPTRLTPVDSTVLVYPGQPPLLSWQPSQGAKTYDVEIDDDPAFPSPVAMATNNPNVVLADPLAVGQPWYWRVRGKSAGGIATAWSTTGSFSFSWPVTPALLSPPDSVTTAIEETDLTWSAVPGAATYDLQVSPSGDFTNNLTVNEAGLLATRFSPPVELLAGSYFWRVRGRAFTGLVGGWSSVRQFRREWPSPAGTAYDYIDLLLPANADYTIRDLRFEWTPQRLAAQYEMQMSPDSSFSVGTISSCVTNQTTFTPKDSCAIDPAPGQVFYWRVRAIDLPRPILGQWSATWSFQWYPELPTPAQPIGGVATSTPALTWGPISNVSTYKVSVYNSAGSLVESAKTTNTTYVPKIVFKSTDGPFSWFVQTVDSAGREGPVPGGRASFTLTAPSPTYSAPEPTGPTTGFVRSRPPLLTWQPVTAAKTYQIWYAPLGSVVYQLLASDLTLPAYAHTGYSGPGILTPGTYSWIAKALSSTGTVIAQSSFALDFTVGDLGFTTLTAPTNCVDAVNCAPEYETPRLDWEPVDNSEGFEINIATDPDFTNIIKVYTTPFTSLTPTSSLPDSQAGQAYYWYPRPCIKLSVPRRCAAFNSAAFAQAHAFRKRSAAVQLIGPADGATFANQVTFDWTDYLTTHRALTPAANQEAQYYQVQVSTTADFSAIFHTSPLLDGTLYSANASSISTTTFPEGQLYWRVQALDASENPLTFSEIRSLVKSSPAPILTTPAAGASVPAAPVFLWQSLTYAARYEIEVYRNVDQPLSSANKVYSTTPTSRVTGLSPTTTLAPGLYGWRVRALDADGRVGPWSATTNTNLRQFTSTGAAPTLLTPTDGMIFPDNDMMFTWAPSAGAVQYRFEVASSPAAFGTPVETATTVMTAWAPTRAYADGSYVWRVVALNASGSAIGTSATSSFSKDQSTLGEFFSLTPARIYDTRPTNQLGTTTRDVQVTGVGGVPTTGVAAVVLNVTATGPTAASWLTVWPTGLTKPTASNLNYVAGQTVANLVVAKVAYSAGVGKVSVANAFGTTNVIFDVVGWYGLDGAPRGARFQAAAVPVRILDTRLTSNPIGSGGVQNRNIQVAGIGGVPANASAVVLNVTAVGPTTGGWLTVYPNGVALPTASNVNFVAGQSAVANLAMVKVGTNSSVTINNSSGLTHVLFDVVGWYLEGNPAPGSHLTSMTPARLLDTRQAGQGPILPAQGTRALTVRGGTTGVPATATAVVLNVTSTATTGGGWLTVWPEGAIPVVSNLNYAAGQTVPNLVIVKVGSADTINIFSQASGHVIVDVVGYF